jgi:hypothetical protein
VIGGQPGPEFDSARLRVASMRIFRLFWHHFVEDIPGGIMFEDQTVDLLPARTTLQTGTGGNGGSGGNGGNALAISAAANVVGGNNSATLTANSGAANATGGLGGNGGLGGRGGGL